MVSEKSELSGVCGPGRPENIRGRLSAFLLILSLDLRLRYGTIFWPSNGPCVSGLVKVAASLVTIGKGWLTAVNSGSFLEEIYGHFEL